MTTIRNPAAPAIDGEVRHPNERQRKERRYGWLVASICASALAVTMMNVLTSVYLYRAGGEIRAVERKLAELSEFEKRIKDRLDLVNTGVQSKFDNLNQDFQARLGTISSDIRQLERVSAAIEARQQEALYASGVVGVDAQSTLSVSEPEPEDFQAESEPVAPADDKAPAKRQVKSPPTISPSYKRIETADGKVYYRKVH
jgi:hypothetical protein